MRYTRHMTKPQKFQPVANPAYAEGMREIRKSNASGGHDSRPKRERSRSAVLRAEIKRAS